MPGFGDIPKPFFLSFSISYTRHNFDFNRENIVEFALPEQSGYTFSIEKVYRTQITDPEEKASSGLEMNLYSTSGIVKFIMAEYG